MDGSAMVRKKRMTRKGEEMTAVPAYTPHPIDEDVARRWWLGQQITDVTAGTLSVCLAVAAWSGPDNFWVLLAASVVVIAVGGLLSRYMRKAAWDATPGAFGSKGWNNRPHPARIVPSVVVSLVSLASVVFVLALGEPWAPLAAAAVAGYFGGASLWQTYSAPRDLPRAFARQAGPSIGLFAALVAADQDNLAALYLAVFAAVLGYIVPMLITGGRRS